MIKKEEVQRIAKLARLELTEAETEKMQKDLSGVLDYFVVLKKAPQINADKKADVRRYENNGLRKDEVKEKPASLANNLVASAPDKQDGYFKVKAIL